MRAHERPACQIAGWPHGLFGRFSFSGRGLRGTLLTAVTLVARSIAATVVAKSRPVATAIATLEAVTPKAATATGPTIAIASATIAWLASALGEGEQREVASALDRRRQ